MKFTYGIHQIGGFLIILFLQLLVVSEAAAQDGKPDLVPQGGLQIESGSLIEVEGKNYEQFLHFTYNDILLRYGLHRVIELQAGISYLGTKQRSDESYSRGLSPALLGLKLNLFDEKGFWPQAALMGHLNFHTAKNAFSTPTTYSDFILAFSHTFQTLYLTYSAGVVWNGIDPGASYAYTTTMEKFISNRIDIFSEVYIFSKNRTDAYERLVGGFLYKINPLLQIDLYAGLSLCSKSPYYFVGSVVAISYLK